MSIHFHRGDLPNDVGFSGSVAVDTETMGLNLHRDRLCVVQMSAGDGNCHVVRLTQRCDAPNIAALMQDASVQKIFHYARFDLAMMQKYLGVVCRPVYCTKIASKLTRTNTDRHGLKDLCRDLLGIEISKVQQCSDWAADTLTEEQLNYAAQDVLHLHALKDRLDGLLEREGRAALAAACFDFLPDRAALDVAGWADEDVFAH